MYLILMDTLRDLAIQTGSEHMGLLLKHLLQFQQSLEEAPAVLGKLLWMKWHIVSMEKTNIMVLHQSYSSYTSTRRIFQWICCSCCFQTC
ncbi:uncharacterized protein LOC122064023 isoform X2 [Macadamia integrifolia]|uniref:uncharacterized protein LOC122064023 isoform X2 n=1 Tax=Macadamia integrifolia TaxID=60698 RepID=UPI001C4FE7A8|nr:uncharacterized protein LOC122064023 isoform X2 [Macadamia integrifolia]